MAPNNGTTSIPPKLKLVITLPLNHSILQWHPVMAPNNGTTSTPPKLVVTLPSPHHGTLQWHPAMAPNSGTTSIPPKLELVITLPPNHSTLEWHPAMAPSNGTTSTPPKLVVTLPSPHHSTLQCCNGTQQWHHVHSPKIKVGHHPPPNHSTLQWYPTMAPSNGTTSTAPCTGTLVPRPIRQSGSSPSPPLEVRTPSYRYLGKNEMLRNSGLMRKVND